MDERVAVECVEAFRTTSTLIVDVLDSRKETLVTGNKVRVAELTVDLSESTRTVATMHAVDLAERRSGPH